MSLFESKSSIVEDYLSDLRKFPQLAHPEVVELFQTYNDKSNEKAVEKARKKLVESNLRLVVSIAKNYRNHKIPIEDLIQEGNLGLLKAIDRFKWEKGYRFSTYATWWIKQAIGQHILKRKRMIRLPAHAATVQRKMMQATEQFREATGEDPTQEELQELVGASEAVVSATIQSGRNMISLSQPLSADGEDSIGDKIEDENKSINPFEVLAQKELIDITKKVLSSLNDKETAILRLRFGLVDDSINDEDYAVSNDEITSVATCGELK